MEDLHLWIRYKLIIVALFTVLNVELLVKCPFFPIILINPENVFLLLTLVVKAFILGHKHIHLDLNQDVQLTNEGISCF